MSRVGLLATASEDQFQATVIELAETCGWRVNHHRRSKLGGDNWGTATRIKGWPDLEIFGHGRLIFAELKTETGRVSPEQRQVLAELRQAGQDARLWRPRDWAEIEATLTRGRPR